MISLIGWQPTWQPQDFEEPAHFAAAGPISFVGSQIAPRIVGPGCSYEDPASLAGDFLSSIVHPGYSYGDRSSRSRFDALGGGNDHQHRSS